MQSIRLTTATDVVASIPALLGFVPVFSIVTLLLTESVVDDHTETRILLAARVDADDRGIDRHSGTLAAIGHRENVTGAITVVIVDGSPVVIDEAISNALAVREHLAHHNIPTLRMLHTANIEEGATWTDLDTLEMSVTVDHRFSDVSVAAVLYGRNVASSAAALYARYGLAAEADMRAAHTVSVEQGDDFVRATSPNCSRLSAQETSRAPTSPDASEWSRHWAASAAMRSSRPVVTDSRTPPPRPCTFPVTCGAWLAPTCSPSPDSSPTWPDTAARPA